METERPHPRSDRRWTKTTTQCKNINSIYTAKPKPLNLLEIAKCFRDLLCHQTQNTLIYLIQRDVESTSFLKITDSTGNARHEELKLRTPRFSFDDRRLFHCERVLGLELKIMKIRKWTHKCCKNGGSLTSCHLFKLFSLFTFSSLSPGTRSDSALAPLPSGGTYSYGIAILTRLLIYAYNTRHRYIWRPPPQKVVYYLWSGFKWRARSTRRVAIFLWHPESRWIARVEWSSCAQL